MCESQNGNKTRQTLASIPIHFQEKKNVRCKTQENNNKKITLRKVIGKLFKLQDGNQQIFDDPF